MPDIDVGTKHSSSFCMRKIKSKCEESNDVSRIESAPEVIVETRHHAQPRIRHSKTDTPEIVGQG